MKVKANVGLSVPYEHKPHEYITETPVEVANTIYYQRLVFEGDLVIVAEDLTEKKGNKS